MAEEAETWLSDTPRAPGITFAMPAMDTVEERPTGRPSGLPTGGASAPVRAPAPPATPPRRTFEPAPRPPAPPSQSRAVDAADLDALQKALAAFDGCGLKATAKTLCFYRGAAKARVMIIGEAPGRDEDLEGRPFVGRAGQLLDKMLASIGLGESNVHITNIVYWRPPGNRTPTPQEAEACRPFLTRQVELVEPDVVLLLGGAATKQILDTSDGIMKIRGRWFDIEFGKRKVKVLPSLHPAYLLRTPAAKRQAWRDLLSLKNAL